MAAAAAGLNWVVELFDGDFRLRSDKRPEEQRKQRFVMRRDTVRKRRPFRGRRSLSAAFTASEGPLLR